MEPAISEYKGFEIVRANNLDKLEELRNQVYAIIKRNLGLKSNDPEYALNNLHQNLSDLSDGELNEVRIKIIQQISQSVDCGELIFEAFNQHIEGNLGPDLLVQKNCNLVIQQPKDNNPSELHRDAPLNSCYEMVVWVPLVDCFKTKSMYMVDYQKTKELYKSLEHDQDWENFERDAIKQSVRPDVKFGEALIFSTTVLHGSTINQESETRVSLNVRYKNMFSPSGLKNQLQFFRILQQSNITALGADLEFEVENYNTN